MLSNLKHIYNLYGLKTKADYDKLISDDKGKKIDFLVKKSSVLRLYTTKKQVEALITSPRWCYIKRLLND